MSDRGKSQVLPVPILFVNFYGTMGGGQVQLLAILDGLDRKRFQPHVVCCQAGAFWDEIKQRGLNPFLIQFGKGKRRYLHVTIPAYLRFYQLIKRLGVKLVHVHGLQEAKLAAYPSWYAKIPMVWVVAP